MHERSLARSLLRQVQELCRAENGDAVSAVEVEVGEMSGVEPALLAIAFESLAPATVADGAEFVMRSVPLAARCERCDLEFQVVDFAFRCPSCQQNTRVIRGDELVLVSVTVDGPSVCLEGER